MRAREESTRHAANVGTESEADSARLAALSAGSREPIALGYRIQPPPLRWLSLFSLEHDASVEKVTAANLEMSFRRVCALCRALDKAHGRRRLVEAARAGDRVALGGVRVIARMFGNPSANDVRRGVEETCGLSGISQPPVGAGNALGGACSDGSLTSSLMASRMTRVVSSSRWASSSSESARNSGDRVLFWKASGARTWTVL